MLESLGEIHQWAMNAASFFHQDQVYFRSRYILESLKYGGPHLVRAALLNLDQHILNEGRDLLSDVYDEERQNSLLSIVTSIAKSEDPAQKRNRSLAKEVLWNNEYARERNPCPALSEMIETRLRIPVDLYGERELKIDRKKLLIQNSPLRSDFMCDGRSDESRYGEICQVIRSTDDSFGGANVAYVSFQYRQVPKLDTPIVTVAVATFKVRDLNALRQRI